MVKEVTGNLWDSKADWIIVPVNGEGVMGAGLAKTCKILYPDESQEYIWTCERYGLKPGDFLVCGRLVFFPTKELWRNPSTREYIEKGLISLRKEAKSRNIKTIAMPAIGCGLGGLDIELVKQQVKNYFDNETVEVSFFIAT